MGHICKKPSPPVQHQKWIPKDKGKDDLHAKKGNEVLVEQSQVNDEWSKPKTVATSFQVGEFDVPTDNIFQELSVLDEGGDLFPSSKTRGSLFGM